MVMLFVLHCFIVIGSPKSSCRTWELTLLNMVNFICTAFGDSSNSYSSSPNECMKCPSQGSKGDPAGCTIICTPLLTAQKQSANGITFYNPSLTSAMFVDDNTSYTNKFLCWLHHEMEPSQVIEYLKHDA
jgi:hypothetical protein